MSKSDEIRRLYHAGVSTAEIARRLGIRYQFARNVIVREREREEKERINAREVLLKSEPETLAVFVAADADRTNGVKRLLGALPGEALLNLFLDALAYNPEGVASTVHGHQRMFDTVNLLLLLEERDATAYARAVSAFVTSMGLDLLDDPDASLAIKNLAIAPKTSVLRALLSGIDMKESARLLVDMDQDSSSVLMNALVTTDTGEIDPTMVRALGDAMAALRSELQDELEGRDES